MAAIARPAAGAALAIRSTANGVFVADVRLRGEWLAQLRFSDMSDATWRVFTLGMLWCVHNGTDGLIRHRHLSRIHPDGPRPEAFDDLIELGLGTMGDDGFQFVDWARDLGQSTAAEVEAYRAGGRRRAQASRNRIRSELERAEALAAAAESVIVASDPTWSPMAPEEERDPQLLDNSEDAPTSVPVDVRANVGNGNGSGSGNRSGSNAGTGPGDPEDPAASDSVRNVSTSAAPLRSGDRLTGPDEYMGGPVLW